MTESKGTVAICTVMYGDVAHKGYVNTLLILSDLLRSEGYSLAFYTMGEEELGAGAKNILVDRALKTKDLIGVLFLDANLSANPEGILSMIESGKDVIGGLVAKSSLNWSSIKNAVILKKENLHLYSGDFSVKFKENSDVVVSYEEPIEVEYIGNNIMYVSAEVFKKLEPLCEKFLDTSALVGASGSEVVRYFKSSIVEDTKELLSEDFAFCESWSTTGGTVWLAPWVECSKTSTFTFEGSFLHSVELLSDIRDLTKQ